ncbi:4-hydroxy-3-methylbut-2-enyl diphosphate reductase [Desulforhopalus singaporensis]|uniref:4-hydroxy-3-methylbut-2-enyl diphosphate reductase n=1 Tax=Desulforhopalus singaporensis TaxID=91360 RepID=A0A1H0QLL9_9BACT|nr:4-hydroxy-3-methylbut-2-enyl diphosphate reductase [Desulforhopalus singaporensis]SDP17578.1 4-hydroxy-3-methylbut-2-enyl diphosphate reductase [Desulforhopalus singaporensis]
MGESYIVHLAEPRGFCAGVERAIDTVKKSLEKYREPIFVLHEIVHNKHVIDELRDRGAIFVEHLTQIPRGEICIFSAHGVSADVESYAEQLGLYTIDATCPLVTSVHRMVEKYHRDDYDILIIGHHNHPEVLGTAGRVKDKVQVVATREEAELVEPVDPSKVGYVTQTTLTQVDIAEIVAVLQKRFPKIKGPSSNICFATQNRQDAVTVLAEKSEVVFVVGSKNSSNSNRLKEVAERCNVAAHLIDDYRDIDRSWLENVRHIGITAGASAPERLVAGVLDWLRSFSRIEVRTDRGVKENIHFPAQILPEIER